MLVWTFPKGSMVLKSTLVEVAGQVLTVRFPPSLVDVVGQAWSSVDYPDVLPPEPVGALGPEWYDAAIPRRRPLGTEFTLALSANWMLTFSNSTKIHRGRLSYIRSALCPESVWYEIKTDS
jgi:hypothetical protein